MTDMHNSRAPQRRRAWPRLLAGVLVLTVTAGCDVTNPGPIQDEFLALPASQQGFVNGAGRKLAEAVAWIGHTTSVVARELFPGGQTGSYGHAVLIQGGFLEPGADPWGSYLDAQQARFIAEEAIRRFTTGDLEVPAKILHQAYIWAGYANRVLGENWCEAVIDGSALQPGDVYFERAEAHFTEALSLAVQPSEQFAALAGRAQVRVFLEDWPGAVSDASQVPTDFVFWINLDGSETETRNHLWYANADIPYRASTVHFTFFQDYFLETGDPRAAFAEDPDVPVANASLSGFGQVPWSFPLKYQGEDDDIRLASGREMRLIEAEALLVQGQWQQALAAVNEVRTSIVNAETGEALEPWDADTPEEAMAVLMRERGIELWLEARRLGDLRRWQEAGFSIDPALPDWEDPAHPGFTPLFTQNPQSLCYDVPDSERDTNPNVPSREVG